MGPEQLCGSFEKSWFYVPLPSKSLPLTNASPSASVTNQEESIGLEWRKWNLQILESLQGFSRWYQPIHGYVCVVLCTFGLLTNILNFIVLTRPKMRTSINVVLAVVAFCDAGTMCSYLIYVVHFYVLNRGVCLVEIYTYNWMVFILFHSLWSILLHSSSIWLAVLLAFMRLSVMKKAKLSHSSLRASHVWKPMSYIYAPLAILCIPVIFTHSVVEIPLQPCLSIQGNWSMDILAESGSRSVGYTVEPSAAALANNCLLLKAVLLINGLCFKLLPCLLLVFSIFRLLQTLDAAKKHNDRLLRRRGESGKNGIAVSSSKYFSSRTTKMLLAVLSIFLITELPQAFIATLSGFYPLDVYFKIYPQLGDLLDLLSLLNSGVNFVLYCGMSSRFRSTFIDLFAPRVIRRHFRRSHGYSMSENENPTTGGCASMNGARQGLISSSAIASMPPTSCRGHKILSVHDTRYYSFDVHRTQTCCAIQSQVDRTFDLTIMSPEKSSISCQ